MTISIFLLSLLFRLNHWRSQGQPQQTMWRQRETERQTVSSFWTLPASIKLHQLLSISINFFQPLPTSSNIFQHLPTSANLSQPQLTSVKLSQFQSNSANLGGPYSTSIYIFQLQSLSINLYKLLSTSANICQPQSTSVNHLLISVNLSQSYLNSAYLGGTKYNYISFCQIISTSVNLYKLL